MRTMVYEIFSIFQSKVQAEKIGWYTTLTSAVTWRCCKKNGNYPHNHTVEPFHSLVRKNCAVQRWFNYPNISVENDKAHIQGRSSSSRRMPIVLGTFTSSSTKFVDLSYHALLCVDAMKALQRLVALNALGCSLIWCRWQT